MQPDSLKELVEGKFVDALRTVAAEMTMEELHEKRGDYVRRVRDGVADDLMQNGLELESASLTQLDQTGMEFFNPSNAFDAEGLTRLTEQIERRKKHAQRHRAGHDDRRSATRTWRPRSSRSTSTAMSRTRASSRSARSRSRAPCSAPSWRASGAADAARRARRSSPRASRSSARASRSERGLDRERIAKEREIEGAEIERRQATELAEQQRAIAVREAVEGAIGGAGRGRPCPRAGSLAEEKVFTARETEMATRRKAIELIGAAQEAERDALRLQVAAEAEKLAANDRGLALRAQAEAEADAEKIRSLAHRLFHEVEAEGVRLMNEAQNVLTHRGARARPPRLKLIEKLDAIIREQVKPLERIEGIKILHVDGLGGGGGGGNGAAGADHGGGFADQVVNSALRYRAQSPLVDQLLREIGIEPSRAGQIASGMLGGPKKPVKPEGEGS